jgi:tRNA 2-(methylsulfanyl)-N6-isopentenyladenosine37 hydroxylase
MTLEKRVLGIQLPTDPRWVNLAEMQIGDILTDHAYCEQKAASSCISLITKFPEYETIVEKLSPVVTEEWGHFRMVLRELKKRGLRFGKQRKDEYVNELQKIVRNGVSRKENLLDRLLVFAMIEARSCERFRLLSLHIADETLRPFYHDLMVAEAGHYRLFLDLAASIMDPEIVEKRWKEILNAEAEIVSNLEIRGDRMH